MYISLEIIIILLEWYLIDQNKQIFIKVIIIILIHTLILKMELREVS